MPRIRDVIRIALLVIVSLLALFVGAYLVRIRA